MGDNNTLGDSWGGPPEPIVTLRDLSVGSLPAAEDVAAAAASGEAGDHDVQDGTLILDAAVSGPNDTGGADERVVQPADEQLPGDFPLRHGQRSHPKYAALYAALESENASERLLSTVDSGRSTPRAKTVRSGGSGKGGRAEKDAPVVLCQEIKVDSAPTLPDSPSLRSKPTWKTSETIQPPARERPSDGEAWPKRDALSFTRSLVFYGAGSVTEEHKIACRFIEEARSMRRKYLGGGGTKVASLDALAADQELEFAFGENGVAEIYVAGDGDRQNIVSVPQLNEFVTDYHRLVEMASDGAMRSFCFQRLQMLSSAFKMHITINGHVENEAQSNLLGTDFYRTMKVDNHIHLAGAPTAKQFVKFVASKLEKEPDTVVASNGETLSEVFANAGLDAEHLTIDAFNVLADYSVYQRFDNFNSKYSPFRLANMRKIFLKVENAIEGRYFAELTKIVLARLEQSKGHNSAAEMRLSIYGMERDEWLHLAKWMLRDWGGEYPGPVLSSHNRWMVQVPRLWRIYSSKKSKDGQARTFQQMLENLFIPLFEATLNPDAHPEIAEMLKHIVGFDSVDDEGAAEAPCTCTRASAWKKKQNPAYSWQLYHLWANIEVLNRLRNARGLNTFTFRPHAGETGDVMHLAAAYMLCKSINHGVNLDRQVSLQYLYYLDQVGLSISPLSNNFLFRKIATSPFPKLFKRGLNVTISTDDPLLFHMSSDALLEEYSVARATFDLSMTDMSELARNSVLQSDFGDDFKETWLGENYARGVTHCDDLKTHVPLIRAKFRAEHLALEHMMVTLIAAGKGKSVLQEMMEAFSAAREAHRDILLTNFEEHPPAFPEQNQL